MSNVTSLIIKIFVVVFGLAFIVWGIDALRSDTSSWPSAQAKIVSSFPTNNGTSYHETYEFQVNNTQYSGTIDNVNKSSPGAEITVYYDPASPGSSITSQGEMVLAGIAGILLGLVCVGGIAWEAFKSITANRQKMAAAQDTNIQPR